MRALFRAAPFIPTAARLSLPNDRRVAPSWRCDVVRQFGVVSVYGMARLVSKDRVRVRAERGSAEREERAAQAHVMQCNATQYNGMEWNGMEWNGMEWNGMEYNVV